MSRSALARSIRRALGDLRVSALLVVLETGCRAHCSSFAYSLYCEGATLGVDPLLRRSN